ncbi:MAG: T6SS AAA+ chaperone ClpV (TssH) [Nitrospira sp.]|jgi:type VI secretion system protein VasG|nr:MAG: T6SS AAA+ chaperone ClpV (TssH) [Nitrospira sp.]
MDAVDRRSLIRRLNRYCTQSLESAAGLCLSRTHYEVAIEHLLLKLLEDPTADLQAILTHFGIEPVRLQKALQRALEEFKSGNAAKPVFSPRLIEWLQETWLIGSIDLNLTEIRSGALLLTMVRDLGRFAYGFAEELLQPVRAEELRQKFFDMTAKSSEGDAGKAGAKGEAAGRGAETALGRFTVDFTVRARTDGIDPIFGRDREIRQMIDILARRRKNNPIVVGEAGVGKTAVVEGLALRIVQGDVPDLLKNMDMLALDLGLLQAGAGVRGEFEQRLKSVIDEVKASTKPIILFIDEAHMLVGAGGMQGMGDAANLLKPALARGELRTIAATTWSEYKKYFEKDAALARRFQLVKLEEPSETDAILVLRGLRGKYEEAHHVQVLDEGVVAAARMSSRYIAGRQLPDKAVDLLDTAAARIKIGLTSKPDRLETIERTIQALERERGAYQRDQLSGVAVDAERITMLDEAIAGRKQELEQLNARWREEKVLAESVLALRAKMQEAGGRDAGNFMAEWDRAKADLRKIQGRDPLMRIEVDTDVIAEVVSDWTGIPVGRMVRDEAQTILQLDDRLKTRIKGQDQAIESIARGIRASKAGIGNPAAPIGVFLFVGPSGVGKTETGLAVAEALFGGERFVVTLNMSEFQEKHTVSRLIGSPPGYVGYGEGGLLTEAIRQRPYSVVLLDEVEKADQEVLNIFYQVFDKGMLADGEGRVIDFKNTVIFLTSNLASDMILQLCASGTRPGLEEVIGAIRPLLSRHFKPALLARMTIVPFYPIDPDVMKLIVELKLNRLVQRLMESHRITCDYEPALVEQIVRCCHEVETGARNIDHIMQGSILPRISTEILSRMGEGRLPERLSLTLGPEGEFTLLFSERQAVVAQG